MRLHFYPLAAALATLVCTSVQAQTATSTSGSTSGATAGANAGASAGAIGVGVGGNNLSGNRTTFRTPRAPGAIGMAGLAASSGCMGSTSAGVGFIGGSIGLGSTWQDQRCNAREDARLLAAFGYREQALQILIANSPMVAQVMGPAPGAHVVSLQGGYQPVSLNSDERYINGTRQIFRQSSASLSEKCTATLGLLQQQDTYLRGIVANKRKAAANQRNVLLVQENLRTGVNNLRILCPTNVAAQAGAEIEGRINQIDSYVATGRWTGPVG
jgi:hypothetical protein